MPKLINKIVMVNNRRTSMRLCLKEWDALYEVCKIEKISKNQCELQTASQVNSKSNSKITILLISICIVGWLTVLVFVILFISKICFKRKQNDLDLLLNENEEIC